MKRRIRAIAVVIAAVAGAVAVFLLLRPHANYLPVSLDIEWEDTDPQAGLGRYVSVDPGGTVYTVEQVNGRHFYHAYSPRGGTIWRVQDRANAGCGEALVSLPEGEYGHLNCWLGTGGTLDQAGDYVWVNVAKQAKISSTVLMRNPKPQIDVLDALLTPDGLYAVGGVDYDAAAAATFNTTGVGRQWVRLEKPQSAAQYDHGTVDADGNLIASCDPYGVAVVVGKYSSEGRLMWLRQAFSASDGGFTVWLGTDKKDNILALVRLHYTLPLTMNQSTVFFEHGSKFVHFWSDGDWDGSGRDQDYVLATLAPNGKLLSTRVMSHGAQLEIAAATQNPKGELYLVGNRWDLNAYGFPVEAHGAELIKCDRKGEFVWSRNMRLPRGCFAKGITWGEDDRLYVFGDSHGGYQADNPPLDRHAHGPPSRFFIYRVEAKEMMP